MENLLKTAHVTESESASLANTNYKTDTDSTYDRSRKRIGESNHDEKDEWKEISFPAFDLHMRRLSFCNSDKRISTIVFGVRCHPYNSLKTIFFASLPMTTPLHLKILFILSHTA